MVDLCRLEWALRFGWVRKGGAVPSSSPRNGLGCKCLQLGLRCLQEWLAGMVCATAGSRLKGLTGLLSSWAPSLAAALAHRAPGCFFRRSGFWAGERAQLIKHLSHKRKNLSSIPQNPCKKQPGSSVCLSSQRWRGGDRRIPGACWLVGLAKWTSSRFSEREREGRCLSLPSLLPAPELPDSRGGLWNPGQACQGPPWLLRPFFLPPRTLGIYMNIVEGQTKLLELTKDRIH